MDLKDARVTIVGLGLMGGSMALALNESCRSLIGVDSDADTVQLARRLHAFEHATTDLKAGLDRCDLLILAVPVRAILSLLDTFRRNPPPIRFLLDIGSTKREIVQAMEMLPPSIDPVGGHPICGKETSGLAAADPELFRHQIFALTPLSRTSSIALGLINQVMLALGARPKLIDAHRHDLLAATTSHLPYLLAIALMRCAERLGAADPDLWELVASGFLGTSRLAKSDLSMMADILMTNGDMAVQALIQAGSEIEELTRLIQAGDPEGLQDALLIARRRRSAIPSIHPLAETMHG